MAKQIVVIMKRNARVEDFIPYVENVARPGMKVIFMLPYPVDGFCWTTEQFGINAMMEGKRLADYYAWNTNLKRAKERIRAVAQALSPKGIESAPAFTRAERHA